MCEVFFSEDKDVSVRGGGDVESSCELSGGPGGFVLEVFVMFPSDGLVAYFVVDVRVMEVVVGWCLFLPSSGVVVSVFACEALSVDLLVDAVQVEGAILVLGESSPRLKVSGGVPASSVAFVGCVGRGVSFGCLGGVVEEALQCPECDGHLSGRSLCGGHVGGRCA